MSHSSFAEYDALPQAIKFQLTRDEYAWLSDDRKADLQREMTTPDHDSEDQAW